MNFYADYIRNQLSSVIENMEHQSEKFVKNPGHDFTRNRKMNFISTINFLLTMEVDLLVLNYTNISTMI